MNMRTMMMTVLNRANQSALRVFFMTCVFCLPARLLVYHPSLYKPSLDEETEGRRDDAAGGRL